MALTTVINNIEQEVITIPHDIPICIYIASGSAAATLNNNGLVDDDNYQQYPKFIRELLNKYYNIKLYIILIDPILENPPYIVRDKTFGYNFQEELPNKYIHNNITVYCVRDYVYINGQPFGDMYVNITDDLHKLNEICKQESILMFYYDYSGKDVKEVADYYDIQVGKYLDHIIYGLGSRTILGCYVNLNDDIAQFAYKLVERNRTMIKVFNVYDYLYNNIYADIRQSIEDYGLEYIHIIEVHITSVITFNIYNFKNYTMSKLRYIYSHIKNNDFDIDKLNKYINDDISGIINKLIETRETNKILSIILDYYSKELEIICKLKNEKITGKELIRIITNNENPYKWYDTFNQFI